MAITKEKIKQWGEKGKVKKLIKCLKVNDMNIPRLAAEELGKLGDPGAVEPLGQMLKDPSCDHISQVKAVNALGEIGGDTAIDCLIDALGFGSINISAVVAELLEKIDDDTILEKLRDKLKHMEWAFRYRSAQLLGKMKDEKAVDPLIKRLKDKNEEVRQAAAEALGNIGDKKAVEPLIEKFNDPRSPTLWVANVLKKIYKSKQISPENKKAILQLKGKVIERYHTDEKKFDPDTCHKDHSDSKHKKYFRL